MSQAIRENVDSAHRGDHRLSVTEVNVAVNDLHMAGDESDDEPSRVQ